MKYFTLNFYLKKVTPYSEKNMRKITNFTPNNKAFTRNLFFPQIRKILNETIFTPN